MVEKTDTVFEVCFGCGDGVVGDGGGDLGARLHRDSSYDIW